MRIFEYHMSKAMFKDLVDNRKGEDKKKNPHKYVIEVVNEQFGILGTCKKVIVE